MKTSKLSNPALSKFYLDLHKSKALLRKFVTDYNADKPLRKQLRVNHIALMEELLEIYQTVLQDDQSSGNLLIPGAPLPYLATNNVQLAKELWCGERSIQNLRHRLKEAGLITEEIWHGRKANYELRLNPEVIFLARRGEMAGHAFGYFLEILDELPGKMTR